MGSPEMTTALALIIFIRGAKLRLRQKANQAHSSDAFIFNGGKVTANELKLLCYCGNNFSDIKKIKDYIEERLANLA